MCFRKPAPGWRLFGRFPAKNVFVGIYLKDRHECGGRNNYVTHAINAIAEWDRLLEDVPFIRGATLGDYIDWSATDVDELHGIPE